MRSALALAFSLVGATLATAAAPLRAGVAQIRESRPVRFAVRLFWRSNVLPRTAAGIRWCLRFVAGPVAYVGRWIMDSARTWVQLHAPASVLNAYNGGSGYMAARLRLAMQRGVQFFHAARAWWKCIVSGDASHAGVELVRALVQPRVLATVAVALAFLFGSGTVAVAMGPIRYLDNISAMQSYTFTLAQDAGKRVYVDLDNGKATRHVQIKVETDFVIGTADGVAVRNNGVLESVFEEVGITGGGETDIIVGDGRALAVSSDYMLNASAPTRSRLTAVAQATYTLNSLFRLWFENPVSVAPKETLFLEKQVNQRLRVFFKWSNVSTGAAGSHAGSGRILEGAATTVATFSGPFVRVQQFADATLKPGELPLFRPRVDRIDFVPPGVADRQAIPIPVDTNEYLRGITILFDSTAGATGAYAGSIALRGDRFEYIGQGGLVNLADFARGLSFESGGGVFDLWSYTALHINFQKAGRLSNLFNPSQDTNLKLYLNINGAPPAGANIIILKHSLIRDLWQDPATGRRVCAPELPADLAAA